MTKKVDKPERFIEDELRILVRAVFVGRYIEDSEFCAELKALERNFDGPLPGELAPWWSIEQQARPWADELSAFCDCWGLTFKDLCCEMAIHAWCVERRRRGEAFAPHWLTCGLSTATSLPDCGDPPAVKIDWDPICESRKSAEERMRAEVDRVMKERFDSIASAHEYLPKPPQKRWARYRKHLDWLFQHQRHGRSYATIAQPKPVHEVKAVQQACKRLANEMGLILRSAVRK